MKARSQPSSLKAEESSANLPLHELHGGVVGDWARHAGLTVADFWCCSMDVRGQSGSQEQLALSLGSHGEGASSVVLWKVRILSLLLSYLDIYQLIENCC